MNCSLLSIVCSGRVALSESSLGKDELSKYGGARLCRAGLAVDWFCKDDLTGRCNAQLCLVWLGDVRRGDARKPVSTV